MSKRDGDRRPAGKMLAIRIIHKLDKLQKDFETDIGTPALEAALVTVNAVEQICAAVANSKPRLGDGG